jgi:hypothetical protein
VRHSYVSLWMRLGLHGPSRIVSSVRLAIAANIQPRMNKMGSSGSYFTRDLNGNTVGIFKPKVRAPSVVLGGPPLTELTPYERTKNHMAISIQSTPNGSIAISLLPS